MFTPTTTTAINHNQPLPLSVSPSSIHGRYYFTFTATTTMFQLLSLKKSRPLGRIPSWTRVRTKSSVP